VLFPYRRSGTNHCTGRSISCFLRLCFGIYNKPQFVTSKALIQQMQVLHDHLRPILHRLCFEELVQSLLGVMTSYLTLFLTALQKHHWCLPSGSDLIFCPSARVACL
jgi:hypothetical protein